MAESATRTDEPELIQIEPEARLVVLARTLQAHAPCSETLLEAGVANWSRFGATCLGQALYRHHSVYQAASQAPIWSHLELSYFRDVVPVDAIDELVFGRQPADVILQRAEILLTTPSSFVMPRDWRGSSARPGLRVSLEYIDVGQAHLGKYRDVMRAYIGPAAARLVQARKIGTFRTMETAAVLYRDPALTIDWNQIHLSEVDTDGFRGFGQEFDAVLREISPDGGFVGVFAGLGRIRTIPLWTFNEPVLEADSGLVQFGSLCPPRRG